jgi:hypothetical protein
MDSIVMYIWTRNTAAAISTESKALAAKLKKWAESEGYKVTFSKGDEQKIDPEQ